MFEYDPKITAEGIATALGVLGAALSYIINLIAKTRSRWKDNRQTADRLAIMEILEGNLITGMSEEEIRNSFESESFKSFRERAGCTKPPKLKTEDYSRYLRDLQWHYMIDQIDKDIYRMRTRLLDTAEEIRNNHNKQLRSLIQSKIPESKIVAVLNQNVEKLTEIEKKTLLETFELESIQQIVLENIDKLSSSDIDESLNAAKELMKILRR